MTLTFRQQIYKTLKVFEGGVECAANTAQISTQQVRVVMTEKAIISEAQYYIVKACQSAIEQKSVILRQELMGISQQAVALSEAIKI